MELYFRNTLDFYLTLLFSILLFVFFALGAPETRGISIPLGERCAIGILYFHPESRLVGSKPRLSADIALCFDEFFKIHMPLSDSKDKILSGQIYGVTLQISVPLRLP